MMTVKEYNEASAWTKIRYRLYRNPFIMFILGPIYVFLIKNRFNVKAPAARSAGTPISRTRRLSYWLLRRACLSAGKTFACSGSDFPYFGVNRRLALYVQHTFEDSYFEADEHWDYVQAAVEGSSFTSCRSFAMADGQYRLPSCPPLKPESAELQAGSGS